MNIPNTRQQQQIASNNLPDTEFEDFIKLQKDYTTEPFLVNDTTLQINNQLRFRKNLFQMTANEKIKRIKNKLKQNKAQYDLDR